ncbi:MAG TPA: hypothetical protein VFX16_26315 [Pseudonocardiaceae bacterium]|nr:hypothetical protein [Pseudonocardiaceae bacterium]
MTDNVTEHDSRIEAGPWTRLAADGSRLQMLYEQRRLAEVLAAVDEFRSIMATMTEPPGADETVAPWAVRESVLGIGVAAAHDLGEWQRSLELNAAIRESQDDRQADVVDRAVTWFNDYAPLLRLDRAQEARELLYECRAAFAGAEHITMMGNTLSALADTDSHLGHRDLAVNQETDALRMKYRGSDPEAVAVSHYNLANYLIKAGQDMLTVWAHRMAAAIIRYQIGSPRLNASVQSISRLVNQRAQPPARSPLSFNALCAAVDSLPEVRFTELFAALAHGGGSGVDSGQAAVDEVMRLVNELRDSAIQESVAAWEPVISALVAAQMPETAAEVVPLLDEALAELRKQHVWRELVTVLQRIQAGPSYHSEHTIDGLDPVSATVATRAKAALAGDLDVDPTLWRELVERD